MNFTKNTFVALIFLSMTSSLLGTNYYISNTGNDKNDGKSPSTAWQTLAKEGKAVLVAGDQLLLAGGQSFDGSLQFENLKGTANAPITIGTFGKGNATINSDKNLAVKLHQCSNIIIKNLTLKGCGRLNGNTANGLSLVQCTDCKVEYIDASGYIWSGINIASCNNTQISHCSAHDNGFSGISTEGRKTMSRNIVIDHCTADNNPGSPIIKTNHSGNGILIGGVTNCLVEYCEASNNGWDMPRPGNGPVGIWAYSADSVVIQYCIAHHNKTSATGKDGGGFDLDGGVTNSILQYNYSYLNEGAGYGLFQYLDAADWRHNIMRYNISVDDGSKNGKCGILFWSDKDNKVNNMSDVWVYNNTIINSFGHAVNYQDSTPTNCHLINNIFVSKLAPIGSNYSQSSYSNNLYWMYETGKFQVDSYTSLEDWSKATGQERNSGKVTDPLLVGAINVIEPITDPTKITTLSAYKLLPNSPCIGAGIPIKDNGGKDLWGTTLSPNGGKVDLGACQLAK